MARADLETSDREKASTILEASFTGGAESMLSSVHSLSNALAKVSDPWSEGFATHTYLELVRPGEVVVGENDHKRAGGGSGWCAHARVLDGKALTGWVHASHNDFQGASITPTASVDHVDMRRQQGSLLATSFRSLGLSRQRHSANSRNATLLVGG